MIPNGYIRVTEPLKILKNYSHIDPDVLKNAADRGTDVHHFCEMHMKNIYCDISEACEPYVKSFVDWYDNNVHELLFVEERVNSATLKLSGQLDIIATLKDSKDKIAIIDIKTPVSTCKTWKLQTAAYRLLAKEEMGIKIDQRYCLKLSKNSSPAKLIQFENHREDEKTYLNLLEIYRDFLIT